jgi:hypothetical protein
VKIIGLCGKPRAGKNAAAEIAAALVPGTAIITFSDEIVEECARLLGIDPATINADKEHYRPFMQWYGFDHKRREDEEYWVKKIEAKLDAAAHGWAPFTAPANLAMVSGVRALNEWVMIKRRGGVVFEVIGNNGRYGSYAHACENQNIPTDGTIKNLGSLEELRGEMEWRVRRVMFPPPSWKPKQPR